MIVPPIVQVFNTDTSVPEQNNVTEELIATTLRVPHDYETGKRLQRLMPFELLCCISSALVFSYPPRQKQQQAASNSESMSLDYSH